MLPGGSIPVGSVRNGLDGLETHASRCWGASARAVNAVCPTDETVYVRTQARPDRRVSRSGLILPVGPARTEAVSGAWFAEWLRFRVERFRSGRVVVGNRAKWTTFGVFLVNFQ